MNITFPKEKCWRSAKVFIWCYCEKILASRHVSRVLRKTYCSTKFCWMLNGVDNIKILCEACIPQNILNMLSNCFLAWHIHIKDILVYTVMLWREFNHCFRVPDRRLDYYSVSTHLRYQNWGKATPDGRGHSNRRTF